MDEPPLPRVPREPFVVIEQFSDAPGRSPLFYGPFGRTNAKRFRRLKMEEHPGRTYKVRQLRLPIWPDEEML